MQKAIRNNAMWNCKNPFQGSYPKVLCVCSAGLLRSATIAWYLSTKTDFNVRAAGIQDYALVEVDPVLVEWADIIICAENSHKELIEETFKYSLSDKRILSFGLPDIYAYRQKELLELIDTKCKEHGLV